MTERDKIIETIRCIDCIHFKHYKTNDFEPTMESLGQCLKDPWDGLKTQWPYLKHPCKTYQKKG